MYKKQFVFLIILVVIVLLFFGGRASDASVPICTSSNNLGKLVADINSANSTSTERIPLILIHGIHGTDSNTFANINGSTTEEKAYFNNFIIYFYQNNLQEKYQLYRFHYLSDEPNGPVTNIADGLRECLDDFIDKQIINDTEFVILAHSMGGLVARSYMQEKYHQTGNYSGLKGGERVLNLITLATPHHGSPVANDAPRVNFMVDPIWELSLTIIDNNVWCKEKPIFFGTTCPPGDLVSIEESNREDLLWDYYNFLQGYNNCPECNPWLQTLNLPINSIFNDKLLIYYGYINANNSNLYDSIDELGPAELLAYLVLKQARFYNELLSTSS